MGEKCSVLGEYFGPKRVFGWIFLRSFDLKRALATFATVVVLVQKSDPIFIFR